MIDDKKLKDSTKSAHRLEMERRKRIEEKQKKVRWVYSKAGRIQTPISHRILLVALPKGTTPKLNISSLKIFFNN